MGNSYTEKAREFIIRSETKGVEGCYYCKLEDGLCYHRLIQTKEHLCFCEDADSCFKGSFHEICKLMTYEQHKNRYETDEE